MSKVERGKTNFWCIHGIITLIVMLLISTAWMYLTGYLNRIIIIVDDNSEVLGVAAVIMVVAAISWAILFGIYTNLSVWIKNRLEAKGIIKIDKRYMRKFYTLIIVLSTILFIISLAVTLVKSSNILQIPYYPNIRKALIIIQKSSVSLRVFAVNLYMCITMLVEDSYKNDLIESLEREGCFSNPLTGTCRPRGHISSGIGATVIPIMAWTIINLDSWL